MITIETVKYVAGLSKLKVDDAFANEMCGELGDIIKYMDTINSTVDTNSVNQIETTITMQVREDVVLESFNRDILLSNATDRTEETPIVPKTVE